MEKAKKATAKKAAAKKKTKKVSMLDAAIIGNATATMSGLNTDPITDKKKQKK